ncbi:MAG: amino acid racemase [Desulfobacterales bacterium]|nr:amino acid racemase [Desulfobacterales bacterium]
MSSTAKTLGIVGGMGPMATALLYEKVTALTSAEKDQDHLKILINSNPQIPDRTAHIVAGGEDPRAELIATSRHLETMGADFLIMPCNTAHYFYEDIVAQIGIPFLHMINETAAHIKKAFENTTTVGILATQGTCQSGVYHKALEAQGMSPVTPDPEMQKHVTDLIYDIKGGKKVTDKGFLEAVESLKSRGATCFILGCTELSVADKIFQFNGPFVDPLHVIATAAIRFAGGKTR